MTTLRVLAALPPGIEPTAELEDVAADCADAVRLELDCRQMELTRDQRELLERLYDRLESDDWARLGESARAAARALGVQP